jgi:hypothetical protein
MNAFHRDVLHLDVILERPGATWFRLQDAVDSFRAAHAALPGLASSFSILSRNEPTAVLGSISARLMATSTRSSDPTIWATWPMRSRGWPGGVSLVCREPGVRGLG